MHRSVHSAKYAPQRDSGAAFVVGAVFCAAIMAAIFTLHGGPDLLAGKVPPFAPSALQSP